jgi:hypothetical protein
LVTIKATVSPAWLGGPAEMFVAQFEIVTCCGLALSVVVSSGPGVNEGGWLGAAITSQVNVTEELMVPSRAVTTVL